MLFIRLICLFALFVSQKGKFCSLADESPSIVVSRESLAKTIKMDDSSSTPGLCSNFLLLQSIEEAVFVYSYIVESLSICF